MTNTVKSLVYTGFIHHGEVQGWYRWPYQEGWVTILQAFPTDGELNVRLEVRNMSWMTFDDGSGTRVWRLEFEVHNLDNNDVVYDLWQTFFQ